MTWGIPYRSWSRGNWRREKQLFQLFSLNLTSSTNSIKCRINSRRLPGEVTATGSDTLWDLSFRTNHWSKSSAWFHVIVSIQFLPSSLKLSRRNLQRVKVELVITTHTKSIFSTISLHLPSSETGAFLTLLSLFSAPSDAFVTPHFLFSAQRFAFRKEVGIKGV